MSCTHRCALFCLTHSNPCLCGNLLSCLFLLCAKIPGFGGKVSPLLPCSHLPPRQPIKINTQDPHKILVPHQFLHLGRRPACAMILYSHVLQKDHHFHSQGWLICRYLSLVDGVIIPVSVVGGWCLCRALLFAHPPRDMHVFPRRCDFLVQSKVNWTGDSKLPVLCACVRVVSVMGSDSVTQTCVLCCLGHGSGLHSNPDLEDRWTDGRTHVPYSVKQCATKDNDTPSYVIIIFQHSRPENQTWGMLYVCYV